MCGFGEKDRRPIDPPPIVRLTVLEADGTSVDLNIPGNVNVSRCMVMADIYSADQSTPCALVANPSTTTQMPSAAAAVQTIGDSTMSVLNLAVPTPVASRNLTGSTGASGDLLRDLAGNLGIFFAFPDLSVRTEGTYTLKFSFTMLPEPPVMTSSVHATVFSEPFEIYPAKRFPGMNKSTALSKKLFDQGVRIPLRKETRVGRAKQLVQTEVDPNTFRRILHSSPLDDVFLTRLFSAFDTNPNSKGVNFKEFIEGLSVFMKGTPDEKLELSFKLYDVDHAGYITRPGLERAMTQLHSVVAGSSQDETHQIQELVKRIFDDLDVNNDGKLSLEEYKLNSMKEPLIIDFLGQFLADQTDSGSNSICSALSVPPSPRSGSSPPSPRFGHFAPPSPRLRDSLYGTASGHVFQSSSPAGSFRLSNSHSLLWLNGGVNGSGDLLGKVNEFEGLVAAEEEQQERERKAALERSNKSARVSAIDAVTPPANAEKVEEDKNNATEQEKDEPNSPVNIVVVPSEEETKEADKTTTSTKPSTSSGEAAGETAETNGHHVAAETNVNGSAAAPVSSDEVKVNEGEEEKKEQKTEALEQVSRATLEKAVANGGLEVEAEAQATVEETTAQLDIQSLQTSFIMGNYISYSRNDIIFSGILIAVWILIRPYFVRMGEEAQARSAARLEQEAAQNDTQNAPAAGTSSSRASRKKLD
ncbi:hypothetical protein BGX28_005067 [Mortierella sp. GBA30]|nr:hypothetical protein BGX28_005067 [Mortierella sp. GBA30]